MCEWKVWFFPLLLISIVPNSQVCLFFFKNRQKETETITWDAYRTATASFFAGIKRLHFIIGCKIHIKLPSFSIHTHKGKYFGCLPDHKSISRRLFFFYVQISEFVMYTSSDKSLFYIEWILFEYFKTSLNLSFAFSMLVLLIWTGINT